MARIRVAIGRFSPFHVGHIHLCNHTAGADKRVILVGSSNTVPTVKNPWTFDERKAMIESCYLGESNLYVLPIRDYLYNDTRWVEAVREAVASVADPGDTVELVGHKKDDSSYYLDMFPDWKYIEAGYLDMDNTPEIHATKIRELMFEGHLAYSQGVLTNSVYSRILAFTKTREYAQLKKEYDFYKSYKQSWAAAPYAPVFVTADSVVIQSGHILLVQRKSEPGKGLWALPGGFVNGNERVRAAAVRELAEETGLKLQAEVLNRSIVAERVFDHPDRSLRGRTITHAFLYQLDNTKPLPKVRGMDDAEKAKWVPLSDLGNLMFFEDHFEIIEEMKMLLRN